MTNASRKEFLGGLSLAALFAGCATPTVKPPRFAPIEIPGLEPRPDFWRVRPDEIAALCEGATRCSKKEVICHTPLGYPVWALYYGDFDDPPPQTNWSAGHSSTTFRNYYGTRKDGRQTFLLVTGIHGAEPECVAGAVNLIRMLETGRDFRGKRDDKLLALLDKYRLIVVPCVNMDGRAISPDHLRGLDFTDFRRASQGYWKDGSLVGWRGSKAWFPLPLDKVAYPGGYPNSEGYNIMHDACPGDLRTAEARALLKLVARHRVDAVLNGHSYEYPPSVVKPTTVDSPARHRRAQEVRFACNLALHEAGLNARRPVTPDREQSAPDTINLNNLFALASGALALTLECTVSYDAPRNRPGSKSVPKRLYTFDELVDVTWVTLRGFLEEGLRQPFVDRGPDTVKPD